MMYQFLRVAKEKVFPLRFAKLGGIDDLEKIDAGVLL